MWRWWRQFVAMPDAERAKGLAVFFASVIIVMLYALGGLSLYWRARYLDVPLPAATLIGLSPAATVPAVLPTVTALPPSPTAVVAPATGVMVATRPVLSPSPTLYPTITPVVQPAPRTQAPRLAPLAQWWERLVAPILAAVDARRPEPQS